MLNLILIIVCSIVGYNLINFLNLKFRENAKSKAVDLAYKCLNEYKILTLIELKDFNDFPFDFDEIEPSFSPASNLFQSRFYFKLTVQKDSEIFVKWFYAFYFFTFKINFFIK